MKTIGIDARLYFQTGVGVYVRNLIHFLQKEKSAYRFKIFVLDRDAPRIELSNPNFEKIPVPYHWHSLSEQFGFNSFLQKQNLDLMHFTYFSYPVLYRNKFLATVHDLTPLHFKTGKASTQNPILYEFKYHAFKYALSQQVSHATRIITPTESIKSQLIATYGASVGSKVTCLYEGVDYMLSDIKENKQLEKRFKSPFFMYVGNFYPHKNVETLIRAFLHVAGAHLMLIGPNDFFASRIQKLIDDLDLKDRITLYTNGSREDLVYFYKHAEALVHPSLSEGFGLPIIEAVHFNTPIIASNIDVFKELLGDEYISFDPQDADDITAKLNFFLTDKPKYTYKEILKKCSFKKMTEETLKVYNELL